MKTSVVPLFLFLFFFFFTAVCFGDDAVEEFKACSVHYNCGDLVNITYPFWGNERQDFCGRREFKLSCKDNKTTTIEINSMEFHVLNINQLDYKMTIARSDLLADYCPRNEIKTATMDYRLFNYSSNDLNLSVWYDCPPINGIPDDYRFVCVSEGGRIGRVNYAFVTEAMNWRGNMRECRVNIEMMITRAVFEEARNNRTMAMERGVKEGFEVEYGNFYTVACDGCREYGGTCGGNATHEFYCICRSGNLQPYVCTPPPPPPPPPPGGWNSTWKGITGAVISVGYILIACISVIIFSIHCGRKCFSKNDKIEEMISKYSTQTPKRYSYSKLKNITGSFKTKIGHGGFSTVYKGKLPDGRHVAVKLLNESIENGEDFINEVISIAKTSHVNVATLLGFCYERKKKALIYEYMAKGSLDKYVSSNKNQEKGVKLDWNTLYNIGIGVARGLEYLHRGCNTRILHFDIKPHNILLDDSFCPKITDFGLAKQCRAMESHVSMTCAKGTIGFIAPEIIFRTLGKASHKSDVYSYGMLVLEMVGERKSPNEGVELSSDEYFPDWIYKDLTQTEMDGGFWWGNTEEEEEMVRKMIIVGLHCIQTLPDNRPSMTDAVSMLEGSVHGLQIPPKPDLFGPPATDLLQAAAASSSSTTSYR